MISRTTGATASVFCRWLRDCWRARSQFGGRHADFASSPATMPLIESRRP